MNLRYNIHSGPAHRVDLKITQSAGKALALDFETVWPTARNPERVRRFQLHLQPDEVRRLIQTLQDALLPPF